jgi:chromate transport protein ChrA
MVATFMEFLDTPVVQGATVAVQYAIFVLLIYLIFQWVRSLSAAGRWKLVKLALTILFLPFVIIWRFTTAGSDCGCCCDEDD